MSSTEESGFRSAEDLFNEACRTQDEQTPYGFLSRSFLTITHDLQELAERRSRELTAGQLEALYGDGGLPNYEEDNYAAGWDHAIGAVLDLLAKGKPHE